MRYFDHGATSWPKPQPVLDAVEVGLNRLGGNPGRGAYRLAVDTSRAIFDARAAVASLLGVSDSREIVFLPGCTVACNLMLKGALRAGDRVLVGSAEHNAIARPLAALEAMGVVVERVPSDEFGVVHADAFEAALSTGRARAVVCQHVSNVTGAINPIDEIAAVAHDAGAVMLCDGAQAAGHLDLDLPSLRVDAYAFSGHKGMLGPQGIGVLYLQPELELETILQGGTGSHSESLAMPEERPDRYETGTPNTPGILGLGAAAGYLAEHGPAQRELERDLARRLLEGVVAMGGYRVLGPPEPDRRSPIVSVVPERRTPAELASRLDRDYDIASRAGLHCAPWAHESVGSASTGACRFGVGYGLAEHDVDALLGALEELA